ncbi:hypothetical protein ALNOE001_18580 [Candidatus Methanobinarius endosymbioticus]|uniref:Type I restriction modification DNA specificity domain-containing protein n=1 Tax=Candidatus Methanobinarius endosymbioticus TaxID=2006182 RepID=A0A366M986_9EURY|nr:hypothetical protein ALNOE001_18580 [Candidatus Methanobinarius endosymbioticus]
MKEDWKLLEIVLKYNIISNNLKEGFLAKSDNTLIKGNLIYTNSRIKPKFSAIYFKGNHNSFHYNISKRIFSMG